MTADVPDFVTVTAGDLDEPAGNTLYFFVEDHHRHSTHPTGWHTPLSLEHALTTSWCWLIPVGAGSA